jgi:hypothetical protein
MLEIQINSWPDLQPHAADAARDAEPRHSHGPMTSKPGSANNQKVIFVNRRMIKKQFHYTRRAAAFPNALNNNISMY